MKKLHYVFGLLVLGTLSHAALISRTYTYSNGNTIDADQNNTNETTLYNEINGNLNTANILDGGLATGDYADGSVTSGKIEDGTITNSDLATTLQSTVTAVSSMLSYKRPNLVFASVTQIEVENNTGIANTTKIVFPDGTTRIVTEDTASANKYRRFDITATANFTGNPEDSGLYTGLSEGTSWYAIYAVKSQFDSTKFVLVGSTVTPVSDNLTSLNGMFGTNGYIYLGMIKNGDRSGATMDILNFTQSGSYTMFTNACDTVSSGGDGFGIALSSSAQLSGTLQYTYVAGVGTGKIPHNITIGRVTGMSLEIGSSGAHTLSIGTPSGTCAQSDQENLQQTFVNCTIHLTSGIDLASSADDRAAILLSGYHDNALGVGYNPMF